MTILPDEMDGLMAIFDEIYAPCIRGDGENACKACVEIGLKKAFNYGVEKGKMRGDEQIKALIANKDCSTAHLKP